MIESRMKWVKAWQPGETGGTIIEVADESYMNDLLRGWRAASRMVLEESDRYANTFNEEGWDIHAKKGRELPCNLKEMDKMLWKAFRAGQQCVGESISHRIRYNDFPRYFDEYQLPEAEIES